MEKYNLLKEYIQKQVKSLLKEEVYGNKAIVYHRTKLNIEELNDIFFNKEWSFGTNAGSTYGVALYTTYSFESQMNEYMISTYGINIIKFSVNLKNFLICDYKEFQKTPQYQRLNKPKKKDENGNLIFIIEQLKEKNIIIKELYNKNENYTSDTILYLLKNFPIIKLLFDGIMYTGEHDGKCCVVFSNSVYNTSIPLGYYRPKNDSPKNINDYQYVSSFNKDSNFKKIVNDKLNKNILNNKNISKNDYINLYLNNEISLVDIPKKFKDYSFFEKIVSIDVRTLEIVPDELKDYSLCEKAVSKDAYVLEFIPKDIENYYSLCEIAVSNNGYVLKFIPKDIENYYSLCEIAVSNDGLALEFVPKDIENYYSLCEIAVSQNGWSLYFIPKDIENYYSLCEKAVSQDKNAIRYIIDPEIKKQILDKFNLKEYIQKQVKSLLKEAVTDEVYHFTKLSKIIKILQTDIFQFGLNTNNTNKNFKYSMSVSRTKSTKTGFAENLFPLDFKPFLSSNEPLYNGDYIIRIKLDGKKLSQNYKSKPHNDFYDKPLFFNIKPHVHEYEDRILSNKPTINNFSKYIIQIDIKQVHNDYAEEEGQEALNEILNQLKTLCNQRNVKLNIVNPNKMDKNYLEEETQPLKKELSQEQVIKNLEKIYSKYSNLFYNSNNYSIGGGLSDDKYVSRRQEDAKNDKGKLTLGQTTQLFKKATGEESEIIKLIIQNHFPNMEWHHAGFIPGRKTMNKTYFLNAKEISELAKDWFIIKEKANKQKITLNTKQSKQNIESYLKDNATYIERRTKDQLPKELFYITKQEMYGKYGWFKAQDKYNMTIYYSGYKFNSQEDYQLFKNKFNI